MTNGDELLADAETFIREGLRLRDPLTSGIPPPPRIEETGSELPIPPFVPEDDEGVTADSEASDGGADDDDDDPPPPPEPIEVECTCEEIEENQFKAPEGTGDRERWYCHRAIQYQYDGDGEETFFSRLAAFRTTGIGEGCEPGEETSWFYDPGEDLLEPALELMADPPTPGSGTFSYTVTFYFDCTRIEELVPQDPPLAGYHHRPVGPETSSGVYLVGICYEGSYEPVS